MTLPKTDLRGTPEQDFCRKPFTMKSEHLMPKLLLICYGPAVFIATKVLSSMECNHACPLHHSQILHKEKPQLGKTFIFTYITGISIFTYVISQSRVNICDHNLRIHIPIHFGIFTNKGEIGWRSLALCQYRRASQHLS